MAVRETTHAPTLRDVAKRAEVSLGTASQALSLRGTVLPETREKVMNAAKSLGYRVRHPEKTKSSHENGTNKLAVIGMLTKHDFGSAVEVNPFFSHVQLGVESECRKYNLGLMLANIEVDERNHPVSFPRMVTEQHIGGLILVGTLIDNVIGGLRGKLSKQPIVLVDSYAPSFNFDSILIDNETGAYDAVSYLIRRGHRHIGLVGYNSASPPDVVGRRDGYLRALATHGIAKAYIENSVMRRRQAYEATQTLLKRSPEVTAFFVCNDDCAVGTMDAITDLGLRVPKDISVVGFDDNAYAKDLKPALTTMFVDKALLGQLGVQRLHERVQHPNQPRVTITIATRLIERDSVAAPRKKID